MTNSKENSVATKKKKVSTVSKKLVLKTDITILGRKISKTYLCGTYQNSELENCYIDNYSKAINSNIKNSYGKSVEINNTTGDELLSMNSMLVDSKYKDLDANYSIIRSSNLNISIVSHSELEGVNTVQNTKIRRSKLINVEIGDPGPDPEVEIYNCDLEDCAISGSGEIKGLTAKKKSIVLNGTKKPIIDALILPVKNDKTD